MHRLANLHGIPSTRIVEELTEMDIESPSKSVGRGSNGSKYHVLVTEHHRNDYVANEDFLEFSLLLVQAVLKLHSIGVLHCDIKWSNFLWNSVLKEVKLLDFGLAQKEENAQSYHATREFEAPEIRENHPHSRMSDAFSVGNLFNVTVLIHLFCKEFFWWQKCCSFL